MELPKNTLKELMARQYEEVVANDKHLYMVTLHPGYIIDKITKRRVPAVEHSIRVLEATSWICAC